MRKLYKHSRERFLGNSVTQLERNFLFTHQSPDHVPSSEVINSSTWWWVPQEAMSNKCICMGTQNGKFLNTSQTQNFHIFGKLINNDT